MAPNRGPYAVLDAAGGGYQSGYSSVMSFADVIRPTREATGYEEDGIRTDETGKGRATPVNNGQSRSAPVTRKPDLTRGITL